MPKSYPRPTFKRLLNAHLASSPSHDTEGDTKAPKITRDADVLVYLAYLTFLQKLAKEVRMETGGGAAGKGKVLVGKKELRKAAKRAKAQMKA